MMRGFTMPNIGSRDDYITATLPTITSDADGKEVRGTANTISFYGKITDKKDKGDVPVYGDQRREFRTIEIECDNRDVAGLTIDYTLTYEGSNTIFQVTDIYDSEFRFTSMVVAKHTL